MRHHILVKWKKDIARPDHAVIDALFHQALAIPGVHSVSVHPNVIDRSNRYDLLILLCMDKEALPLYDACPMHHEWKDTYGPLIESKAIFDCE